MMRKRAVNIALLTFFILLSLILPACSGVMKKPSIEITCDDFAKSKYITKTIEVSVYDSFTVTICSNPTTGFQWMEAMDIDHQNLVRQMDEKFIAGETTSSNQTGTAGYQQWTFVALQAGTATITNEYDQPWEGGTKKEGTFKLTVTVK